MKKLICLLFLLSTVVFAKKGYEGYWMMNEGKFIIKIDKTKQEEYVGHVVWLKDICYPKGDEMEGIEQYDRNNPDEKLRVKSRKVMGLQIVGDLYEKKGKLKGGWVYDSWHGKRYHGSAKLIDEDHLKLRGSFDKAGILGVSQKAKRVKDLKKYNLNK
ncbi:MAG: DUF2147 domain-containing protein [Fusobacterium sp. JB021]|nr:DUF2147 domain-containing protein [Fusobacterium sp. JB021]MDP0506127.1 DUF2147 domain-containing protein [Fusobacterium sp. JB019]